jgi:hypothetical protein
MRGNWPEKNVARCTRVGSSSSSVATRSPVASTAPYTRSSCGETQRDDGEIARGNEENRSRTLRKIA